MKKYTLLILTCLVFQVSNGQKKLPQFGQADINELRLGSCSFEPGAVAMKLLDVQEIEFEIFSYGGTKVITERRVRIKVFNEKGFDHASIRIPYFNKKGIAKIKEFDGVIYNLDPNGKIVTQRLERDDFFKQNAVENVGIINFTFPNLKPGSVIEYKYTTVENNVLSIAPWIIQGEIPVAYTSVSITTPAESKLVEKVFGADTIEKSIELLKYDMFRRTTCFKNNVASFHPEPYMSSYNDNIVKVAFVLFPRGNAFGGLFNISGLIWNAAGRQLLVSKYFETQVGKVIPGSEPFIDSAKKMAIVADRINFIYNIVQQRWPGRPEQTTRTEDLAEAWNDRSGTSTEINLVLLNFLEKADIKCVPVFISTRENGIINKDFPSLGQINGVDIMAFDSTGYYLLDASIKHQSFKNPPVNILNREVFVLSPDSMQWVTIRDMRPLVKQTVGIIADMKEDGKMEGSANIQYFDYSKSYKLDSTLGENEKGEEKYLDKKPAGLTIVSIHRDLTENADDPLFEAVEFVYEPSTTNDFCFIDPQILTPKNKNPFLTESRNTSIDFGCNQIFVLTIQIHLNGLYQVDHLPKNFTIRAPDSSFFYKVVYSSDTGNIYMSQIFEVKRTLFPKEDYPGIRDFFRQMYGLMNEELVLKRKK